jgi:hypothetical protein
MSKETNIALITTKIAYFVGYSTTVKEYLAVCAAVKLINVRI